MKKFILLFIVISIFGCETKENFKTIILKTSGNIEVKPDEASIFIQLNCVDTDIVKAKNCLIDKSDKLNSTLLKHGIDEKDILTTRVDLNKDYDWVQSSSVFKGYRASTSSSIIIRDLKTLEKLYPELLTNKQLSIGGLTFHHSKIDSLNNLAYLKALDNANQLADNILSKLPESNKMITQISNIEISKSNDNYEIKGLNIMEDQEMAKSKMTINTGNMRVVQLLYIEFKIY